MNGASSRRLTSAHALLSRSEERIVALLLGISGIGYAVYFVFSHPHGGFKGFYDPSAALLIGLGPISVMLLSHSLKDFFTGLRMLVSAIFRRTQSTEKGVINFLTAASALVRQEGIGALVKTRDHAKYELLRDGVSLIINDFSADEIRHNLTAKINTKQSQYAIATKFFENMSKICPGIGMIGTLMGLIQMLSNMTDPANIGSGMAMAMITTLYGLAMGTIVYGPFGEKINLQAERMLEVDLLVMEGVLTLKAKKSSIHLKDIIKTHGSTKTGDARGQPAQRGA